MKFRHIFLLPVFLALVVLFVVFYYKFDPALLTRLSFYVNLANPYMRIVRVEEGLRKEEVAKVIADKLDWSEQDKENFINNANSASVEGHYFPKTYLIYKDDNPSAVTATMLDEFGAQVSKIKKPKSTKILNEDTALKVASIIQREAAGKKDMNLISGIIWNRIFKGMKLQIDATLQYAKGSEEDGWWGQVTSEDKKIKSPYNTYLYAGLPPGAIANPGLAAISAAYNPQKTNCLFYLHDKNRKIHCTKTYEEHKRNIKTYLK
ncbi:MAG: endolytic transglycosylase MltG [Patescibacteria group bacterium]